MTRFVNLYSDGRTGLVRDTREEAELVAAHDAVEVPSRCRVALIVIRPK